LKFQLSQIARNNFRCKLANDLPACRNCDKKAARAGRPCDAKGGARQPAKATPFAGGNEADGLKKSASATFFQLRRKSLRGRLFWPHQLTGGIADSAYPRSDVKNRLENQFTGRSLQND
jgi:hypothetical protein